MKKNNHNLYTPNSILTSGDNYFSYLEMDKDTINIEDIATALSHIPRWLGHTPKLYSVAQHCCWCCDNVEGDNQLAALLHDATEAYLGDMPSPLKSLLPGYRLMEERLSQELAFKFGIPYHYPPEVKAVDKLALDWEWDNFKINKPSKDFDFWSPAKARREFLKRFKKFKNPTNGEQASQN